MVLARWAIWVGVSPETMGRVATPVCSPKIRKLLLRGGALGVEGGLSSARC